MNYDTEILKHSPSFLEDYPEEEINEPEWVDDEEDDYEDLEERFNKLI